MMKETVSALIIDDEIDICFLLREILKSKNISTSCATTLFEARNVLKGNSPLLIFLDNHLPDGLGIDFISYIKKANPLANILMITANDTSSYKERALSEGAADYIKKPFTKERICEAIDGYLQKI